MLVKKISTVLDSLKVAWQRMEGNVVFSHPTKGSIIHVAMCKDDGTPLWDQPLHAEPVGAVSVPVNSKRQFGVVRVERPTVKASKLYTYPDLDLRALGVTSIEFPRGFPEKGERGAQTVRREVEEEIRSPIRKVTEIGEITPNTAFHPHRIPVYLVVVDESRTTDIPPDVNEKILAVEWMDPYSLTQMIRDKQIHCAMTLAAFTLAMANIERMA